jgi:hypothetical protein
MVGFWVNARAGLGMFRPADTKLILTSPTRDRAKAFSTPLLGSQEAFIILFYFILYFILFF